MDVDGGAAQDLKAAAKAGMEDAALEALFSDPTKLTEPIKTVRDKFALLPAFLKVRSLVQGHHVCQGVAGAAVAGVHHVRVAGAQDMAAKWPSVPRIRVVGIIPPIALTALTQKHTEAQRTAVLVQPRMAAKAAAASARPAGVQMDSWGLWRCDGLVHEGVSCAGGGPHIRGGAAFWCEGAAAGAQGQRGQQG